MIKIESASAAILLLMMGVVPCIAADRFAGFNRTERLRLSQKHPIREYMVLDDFPMRILAPSWNTFVEDMEDSESEVKGRVINAQVYDEALKRQLEDSTGLKQKYIEFSRWLAANGVPYLNDAFHRGHPMQTVLTPVFFAKRTPQHGVIFWDESRGIESSFSVGLTVPPQPRSFQEQFPVIFHEWGHYVFHRMMEDSLGHPVSATEAEIWLGPLDEGFADFVSYSFVGPPAHLEPPMRVPLSSSFSDRERVFDGTYPYFQSEIHSGGELFRDVLIRISVVYGTPFAMQIAREIAAEDLAAQKKATDHPEKAANAAVVTVLRRRAISLDALLQ